MIPGKSFQPGAMDREVQDRQQRTGSAEGVQEAIKVLSLRLPKVVGAQAVAPSPLLQSEGSGGRHVDSIVERVMAKYFPQAASQPVPTPTPQAAQAMPSAASAPSFGVQARQPEAPRQPNFWQDYPRIVIGDLPPPAPFVGQQRPGQAGVDGGGSFPNSMIAPFPDLRRQLDWVPSPPDPMETPLI